MSTRLAIAGAFLFAFIVSACTGPVATPIPAATNTPPPTSTASPSPTPMAPPPTPTAVLSPTSITTPTASVAYTMAAYQAFEKGFMIWLESRGEIWVALCCTGLGPRGGQWMRVEDKWKEGMPESDPSIVAPPDLLQPIRGFGLAWRTYSDPFEQRPLTEVVGWATELEAGYTARVEHWPPGTWRINVPSPNLTYCFYESTAAWNACPADSPP